jgi:hypothetical protein
MGIGSLESPYYRAGRSKSILLRERTGYGFISPMAGLILSQPGHWQTVELIYFKETKQLTNHCSLVGDKKILNLLLVLSLGLKHSLTREKDPLTS